MHRATAADKTTVINILTISFISNKSVNFLVRQGPRRSLRIRALMAYAFELCMLFGQVWLDDEQQACALLIFPETKKTSFRSMLLDLQLIRHCIGWSSVRKVMAREAAIRAIHPPGPKAYLWFIGVAPAAQHKGLGSQLMQELLAEPSLRGRTFCLETSTQANLPWYARFGFERYHEFDWGYRLYCLKQEPV
jgi:ribosomal protein S18 acetylase RimI-like enzyme